MNEKPAIDEHAIYYFLFKVTCDQYKEWLQKYRPQIEHQFLDGDLAQLELLSRKFDKAFGQLILGYLLNVKADEIVSRCKTKLTTAEKATLRMAIIHAQLGL
jgi:hypothetical protein